MRFYKSEFPARNLTKQELSTFSEGYYLQRGENVLITGATSGGKSYLACALCNQACMQGHKTTYIGMNRLLKKLPFPNSMDLT